MVLSSTKPGPIESFSIWWDEHKAKGQLNGVDKSDALMVWMSAHRTFGAEAEFLRSQNGELHRQIDYIRSLTWDDVSDQQIAANLRRMLDRPKGG